MSIQKQLFVGDEICLAPMDHETDPEIISKWSHDSKYMRMVSPDPAMPLAVYQVKKKYEAIEKQVEEDKNGFYFTIRIKADDRLIGFIRLFWIEWANGTGTIEMGIGDAESRNKGYGSDALRLMLRYAFDELNLHRISAHVPEYNPIALHVFTKLGFVEEVRRRQAFNRDGRRWDDVHLGILRSDWTDRKDK